MKGSWGWGVLRRRDKQGGFLEGMAFRVSLIC